ncbi:MAG: hypothetical protein ABI627_31960 [Polyangiaceae bacterium]
MLRLFAVTIAGMVLLSCGPDRPKCTGSNPDFIVTLKLSDRALPNDIVVHVQYGGAGTEDYVLAAPTTPEVVFCFPADENGKRIDRSSTAGEGGEAGSAGAVGSPNEEQPVPEIVCSLWTGGYTTFQANGTGLDDTSHALSPTDACIVKQTIVLDSPDGG